MTVVVGRLSVDFFETKFDVEQRRAVIKFSFIAFSLITWCSRKKLFSPEKLQVFWTVKNRGPDPMSYILRQHH